jgi:hypothetical protein
MFNPYSEKVFTYKGEERNGMERNRYRQEIVLSQMLEYEWITQEEYDAALADDVYYITIAAVMTEGDGVLDRNVVGVICPMYITIKSDVLPTMAIVTVSEGGEVGYSEAQIAETLNTPV